MKHRQITNWLLMIRPAAFGFNRETATSNAFQVADESVSPEVIASRAVAEFDRAIETIRMAGVSVLVVDDSPNPPKTDAVFPNNWISFHEPATAVTYPMFSENRRREVRPEVLQQVRERFVIDVILPLEHHVNEGRYLEGTGSMVMDRIHRIAFACRSNRTDEQVLNEFCRQLDFRPVVFDAVDQSGKPIYHTNVLMALSERQAVCCLYTVRDRSQRQRLEEELSATGRRIIPISLDQLTAFAGNMLQVRSSGPRPVMLLSKTALESLDSEQVNLIGEESEIVALDIPTIERFGGGSVRCMLAEIFLEPID